MRVAFDATPALSGLTGVARYTRALATGLTAIGVDVVPFAIGRGPGQLPRGTRHLRVPLRIVQPVWRAVSLPPAEWLARDCDVTHSLDLMPPPTRRPLVATFHDAAALDRPDLHPPEAGNAQRRQLDSLADAAIVLAVSAATKAALVRHGIEASRIVVTPLAPIPAAAHPIPPADPSPYVLAVGELTPRKDYPTLLRALALEPARSIRLVVVGPAGFRSQEVTALAAELGLDDRVAFVGHVSDAALAGLYRHATALCLPSVIEGFGLPLVEAMTSGLPIVASDIEAVREVTADAALRVPVGDAASFAVALHRIDTDVDLATQLKGRGLARAEHFSWEKTAAATLGGYERALACG